MQYQPKENLGLGLVQAASGIYGGLQQAQQADQTKQFQQAYGKAYASGDRNAMRQLAAQYPTHFDEVTKGMAVLNDQNKSDVGNTAADLRVALSTGNPQTVQAAIQRNQGTIQNLGLTPDDVMQQAVSNPGQFMQTIDMIGMHALSPDKYFGVLDQKVGRDLQASGQQVQREGQQMQAQTAANGQAVTMRGQNMQAQTAASGQDIQRANLDLNRQKNEIALEQAKFDRQRTLGQDASKSAASKQALDTKKQDYVDAYTANMNTVNEAAQTVADLKSDPEYANGRLFGTGARVGRYLPGSDFRPGWSLIEKMQGQARLMGMKALKGTGSVTEAEGLAAQKALLNLTPGTGAEASQKAIDRWVGVIQKAQTGLQGQGKLAEQYANDLGLNQGQQQGQQQAQGQQQPAQQQMQPFQQPQQNNAPQAALQALQADPSLINQFVQYYGYRPEGY